MIHFSTRPVFNRVHTAAEVAQSSTSDGICTLLSRPFSAPFEFSSLVLSANLGVFFDGCLLLEMQVGDGKQWSPFYKMGLFSEMFQQSFPAQADDWGRVAVDELQLSRPAKQYRFRLRLEGEVPLLSVGVSGVRAPFVYREKQAAQLPSGTFAAKVWPLSQKEQALPDKNRICSPVSLCMALNALGRTVPLPRVLENVYDRTADIYGNWLFNVAYASQQGVDAYVWRFNSLRELEKCCSADSLVVASIAYQEDELPGAAQPHTPGHLVLIRGYQDGKILVADPAGETAADVLRAYDAGAFARAWLNNKQGAAYLLRKR